MAGQKISALTQKDTFGDDDFIAGTQGTLSTDNRKYSKNAIIDAVSAVLGGQVDSVVGTATEINVNSVDPANPVVSLATEVTTSLGLADSAIQSIVAGANVTVDATDPQNPIVSSTGGVGGTDHALLSNLDWLSSGHTSYSPKVLAGFDEYGETEEVDLELEITGNSRQYTKGQLLTNVALVSTSGIIPFDPEESNSWTLNLDENGELQLPTTDIPGSHQIRVYNDGGFTLTFQTGYKVLGDTPSTTDTEYILVNIACFGDNTPWVVVNNQP